MAANPEITVKKAKEVDLLKKIREQLSEERWGEYSRLFESTLRSIQASPQAHSALKDLVRAGCNPAVVLQEIGLFCGADQGLEKRAKHARSELKALATRLQKDAAILHRITWEFMFDNYDPYNKAFGSPKVLGDVAKSLTVALSALKKHTHGKTIRNKHLVYLSYHIKAATKHPHYKEIAHLIACLPDQQQRNIVVLSDTLRKTVQRHQQQDPTFFRAAKAVVERDLDSWRYFFG
jgi:hypothetical protein